MDADSRMDLDDAVAGHPIAMRELAELRALLGECNEKLDSEYPCPAHGDPDYPGMVPCLKCRIVKALGGR
jgi:hypothetical protein